LLENTRFAGKFVSDFSIIREPMYKYKKSAKERFLSDISMAFLFMYFASFNDGFENQSQSEKAIWFEFESMAMQKLKQE